MPRLIFKLKTVSPLFLHGSEPRGTPEFRAPSIRGQLRYWLRALVGATDTDLNALWTAESSVFGSTGGGSTVAVQVRPVTVSNESIEKSPLMPHRGNDRPSNEEAIQPDTTLRVIFVTRPGVAMPPRFLDALSTWLLLGGVGKRSRRMFGGFAISGWASEPQDMPLNEWWVHPTRSVDELANAINGTLMQAIGDHPPSMRLPDFPTLHPDYSRVIVGHKGFVSAKDANVELFHELLRKGKYRAAEEHFGYARGGRRASPLHAQVRQIGEFYYPVLTFMRSNPELPRRQRADVSLINDFMNDAERLFDGQTVWGGPFA